MVAVTCVCVSGVEREREKLRANVCTCSEERAAS
jgi:hypothetical protein